MQLTFTDHDHRYDSGDGTKWTSVSTLIHKYVPHFDAESQSVKSATNKKSKWYGMTPEDIRKAWDDENLRSRELGSWYHNKKEQELLSQPSVNGLQIYPSTVHGDGTKISGSQQLAEGVYPEHLCYMVSAGICGQSDIVTIQDNTILVDDYKSNKEIRMKGYYDPKKQSTQRMLAPISHMDDCEYTHYSLQLSMYAYIIHRHNPQYKVGKLTIHHIQFEQEGTNTHGYPIYKLDNNKEPIVKDIIALEVPYLRTEIEKIIAHHKENHK